MIKGGEKKDNAILMVLRRYISEKSRVVRGRQTAKNGIRKLRREGSIISRPHRKPWTKVPDRKASKVFVDNKIFTKRELHARYEVEMEAYAKRSR